MCPQGYYDMIRSDDATVSVREQMVRYARRLANPHLKPYKDSADATPRP